MKYALIPVLVSIILFGATSLTHSKASGPVCGFTDHTIFSSATGSTYSEAYNTLVADLQDFADAICTQGNGFGTCLETITVLSSEQTGGPFGTWTVSGKDEFRCLIDF